VPRSYKVIVEHDGKNHEATGSSVINAIKKLNFKLAAKIVLTVQRGDKSYTFKRPFFPNRWRILLVNKTHQAIFQKQADMFLS